MTTIREHAEAIVRQWDGVSVAKGTSVDHAQAILALLDEGRIYSVTLGGEQQKPEAYAYIYDPLREPVPGEEAT